MTDYRVLALALSEWEGPWRNRQQVLSRLATRHPVLYSHGPFTVWDRHREAFARAPWRGRVDRRDGVLIDRASKLLLNRPHWPLWEGAVARLLARRWHRALRGDGPLVAIVYHPDHYPLVNAIRADHLVYYAYDQFNLTAGWSARQERMQAALTAAADLVIASAAPMADALQGYTEQPVRVLPNGADVAAFAAASDPAAPEPADLAAIPHPRIGYVGNLNSKVDFPLIAALARREPNWHFVFVGGRGEFDAVSQRALADCDTRPNVHFLGARRHTELPGYTAAMDVNLICYRIADGLWSVSCYPLKLHEYLATGRPVISADLIVMQDFGDVVRVATGEDAWHAAIADALRDGGTGDDVSRRRVAFENSWDDRVDTLDGWISEMVAGRPATGT